MKTPDITRAQRIEDYANTLRASTWVPLTDADVRNAAFTEAILDDPVVAEALHAAAFAKLAPPAIIEAVFDALKEQAREEDRAPYLRTGHQIVKARIRPVVNAWLVAQLRK